MLIIEQDHCGSRDSLVLYKLADTCMSRHGEEKYMLCAVEHRVEPAHGVICIPKLWRRRATSISSRNKMAPRNELSATIILVNDALDEGRSIPVRYSPLECRGQLIRGPCLDSKCASSSFSRGKRVNQPRVIPILDAVI